jgi:hypothetical protein
MRAALGVLLLALFLAAPAAAADKDKRVYELRIYTASSGKLDALNARFRDHTMKLFEKHGMTNVGYWVPVDNKDSKLYYILSYPSRDAREKSWKEFQADDAWKKARDESEKNGKLVAKVEHLYLTPTDYSPVIKPSKDGARVFELRVYNASTGNFGALNARFRNHTLKLFEKHGMTNIGYWVPMSDQKGADEMLYYILAHKSVAARTASFDEFRKDEDWIKALKASEEKAGGPLTAKNGVGSLMLKPTDYSPMK